MVCVEYNGFCILYCKSKVTLFHFGQTMKYILAASIVFTGCGTLNSAIPLDKGEHALGLSFGGPLITALGPPIPTPSLVVEGVSGVEPLWGRPSDLNYGINMTALAFGTLGLHTGGSLLVLKGEGARPNLSVSDRFYLYTNWLDRTKPKYARDFFALDQVDLTASWAVKRHLLYGGLSSYIDIGDPELSLAPFVGTELRGKNRFFFQWELRHMAANRKPDIVDVTFASPGGYGAISTTLSVGWMLKGER